VTIAKRPFVGRDGGSHGVDLPDEQSKIFFQTGLDTGFEKLPVEQITGAVPARSDSAWGAMANGSCECVPDDKPGGLL
jgi:hypothetical protein